MDPRSAYREGSARGASGARLVVLLYEQAIQDLRRAALAIEQKDIEQRTRHINHALAVVGHLQATVDRGQGGQVGRNLDRFYFSVRARLIEANARASSEILYEQISNLLSVREAWIEVDQATSKIPGASPAPARREPSTLTAGKAESTVWRG